VPEIRRLLLARRRVVAGGSVIARTAGAEGA
jgi:hypothetical protein